MHVPYDSGRTRPISRQVMPRIPGINRSSGTMVVLDNYSFLFITWFSVKYIILHWNFTAYISRGFQNEKIKSCINLLYFTTAACVGVGLCSEHWHFDKVKYQSWTHAQTYSMEKMKSFSKLHAIYFQITKMQQQKYSMMKKITSILWQICEIDIFLNLVQFSAHRFEIHVLFMNIVVTYDLPHHTTVWYP